MGTKREELEKAQRGEGCLGKAADDEPLFIVKASDKIAPMAVDTWIQIGELLGVPAAKLREARALYAGMLAFQRAHPERVKLPD